MSQTWVRVGGGIVAFVLVALIGIVGLFGFAPDQAQGSWALVGVLSLGAAFLAYAAIEYRQTKTFDSIARQFDTRTIVLMPLAIAMNIILGQAVGTALKVPIYLDSIGTILVGALAGPLPGALTGILSNLLWTYAVPPPFQSPYAAPFAVVAGVIGLLAGAFAWSGWLRPRLNSSRELLALAAVVVVQNILVLAGLGYLGYRAAFGEGSVVPAGSDGILVILAAIAIIIVVAAIVGVLVVLLRRRDRTAAYVVLAGLLTGLIAAFISAPISANVFGGVTGSGTDFLVAAFRQGGADVAAATLGQGLISDPIDKVTTFFVVYLILGAMAVRTKARFPQGERLLSQEDMDAGATSSRPH